MMRKKSATGTAYKGHDSLIISEEKIVKRYSALYRELLRGIDEEQEALDAGGSVEEETTFNELVGRQHGGQKYLIRRKLSSGGMGTLYYAFDQDFGRCSVMKVILPALKHDSEVARSFVREARITAQLEHPNIVPVHDLGYLPNYGIFFTMKYVRGEALIDVLHEIEIGNPEYSGKYDIYALLTIFRKVCDAVAFAHSKGVLHRDIKPHNIMVGDYGEVLLMDWGLAKLIGQPEPALPELELASGERVPTSADDGVARGLSSSGILKGSPGYMSPEQARGRNDELDARSDVFLLGATLYHILTFYPPYVGSDIPEILEAARDCNYPPPESMDVEWLHLPEEVYRIIRKALAANPAKRYQTVEELAVDVDGVLHGKMDFHVRRFAVGEFLMREGETGSESYLILEGKVEVYKERDGKKVQLALLGPTDNVGEMALLTHDTRSASVVALEDTQVMVLTEEGLTRNLKKLPPWLQSMVVHIAKRLREANTRLFACTIARTPEAPPPEPAPDHGT